MRWPWLYIVLLILLPTGNFYFYTRCFEGGWWAGEGLKPCRNTHTHIYLYSYMFSSLIPLRSIVLQHYLVLKDPTAITLTITCKERSIYSFIFFPHLLIYLRIIHLPICSGELGDFLNETREHVEISKVTRRWEFPPTHTHKRPSCFAFMVLRAAV